MKKIALIFLLSFVFICQSNSQCLSGIYTIGGTNPSFPSFSAATNSLITNGVCGAVVFNVRPGTYTEQIYLPMIVGTSSTNTVTFQSENGDSASVTLAFPSSSSHTNNYLINLDGIDHVKFQNMTFVRTGINMYGKVIVIQNNSDSIVFRKNTIKSMKYLPSTEDANLVHSYTGGGNDYVVFTGNRFQNGFCGIFKAITNSVGFVLDSNEFTNQNHIAIYINGESGFIIKNNYVFQNTGNNMSSRIIDLRGCSGIKELVNNKIVVQITRSILITSCPNILVANNFIVSDGLGLEFVDCNFVDVIHNSISAFNPICIKNFTSWPINLGVRNNILYTSNVNGFGYCLESDKPISSNGNAFSTKGTYAMKYNGVFYSTLSDWQNVLGEDLNSVSFSTNPFVSATDLHIAYDDFMHKKGVWVNNQLPDIDGQIRPILTPSIGADEFQLLQSDARIFSIKYNAIPPYCVNTYPIVVGLYNGGQSNLTNAQINWSVNNVVMPPYNWSGNLLNPNSADSNIVIGNRHFNRDTSYVIKVWATNLNTGADIFPQNDTLTDVFIIDGLSGIYTVGGASPDFITLDNAHNALKNKALCGPVIFDIRPGTYNFSNKLEKSIGSSATNTITFRAENGDSNSVAIYPVSISGGSNYIFDHVKIYIPYSTGFGNNTINISNKGSHNVFKNCVIKGLHDTNTGTVLVNDTCHYNDFYNNYFIGTKNTTFVCGYNQGFNFKGNYFEYATSSHNDVNSINSVFDTITGNIFNAGVYIANADSCVVAGNEFKTGLSFSGKGSKIFNNFIFGGVSVGGDNNTFVVHNTIRNFTTAPTTGAIVGLNYPVVFQNNLIRATGNMTIFGGSTGNYINSNYNILWAPLGFVGPGLKTLSDWQINTFNDLKSQYNWGNFVSTTNSHLYHPSAPMPNAQPVFSFCTKDIDGDNRNPIKPEIGADEYASASNSFDGGLHSFVMPSIACYGNNSVKIRIKNNQSDITLSQAIIKWSINNTPQADYHFAGSIKPQAVSDTIIIGSGFLKGGTNTIKVWIHLPNGFADLNSGNDTLTLTYYVYSAVNLGVDTTICEGNSINLNAGNFVSYLWSNGNTTSSINITTSTNCYVTTVDSNNCVTSDSIKITIPSINLGKDTALCINDSLLLNATTDFHTYIWSTNNSTSTIIGYPGNTYWVTGYGANSCISKDTIFIGTNQPPVVFLGKDTTICLNSSISLSPGSNFANYDWSTGASSPLIYVSGGVYGSPNVVWVEVIDANGCVNSDTINVYAKTVNATITCTGAGAILDAGPGYMMYQWTAVNNLFIDTTQIATVTTPDIYKIWVMSYNNCSAMSQYNLNSFSAPSSSFTYNVITSSLINFYCPINNANYLWNFGDGTFSTAQNPSHSYSQSNNYTVTLTVSNACGGATSSQIIPVGVIGIQESNNLYALSVFPNPYYESTRISYTLKEKSSVNIEIYNLVGQKISVIENEIQVAGEYNYNINAKSLGCGSGVYLLKAQINNQLFLSRIIGLE